jgi:hypothetical protein
MQSLQLTTSTRLNARGGKMWVCAGPACDCVRAKSQKVWTVGPTLDKTPT